MGFLDALKTLFRRKPAPASSVSAASAATADALARASREPAAKLNARGGMRVLVIDDSETVLAVLGQMLRYSGHVVMEALDAEKGVKIATTDRPDLIFLDIVLPGMNGFTALRLLRRQPATRDIPVIMMSGNEQATEQFYAQKIGADDFMKKPFSRAEVFSRIERLLDDSLLPRRQAPISVTSEQPVVQL